MRSFIVPPPCGCGWRIIATGARGRGPGVKRPSRRPSGPGKMTSGMATCAWLIGRRSRRVRARAARLYRERAPLAQSRNGASRLSRASISITPRPRRCGPKRARRWRTAFARWANPSSPHAEGRAARAALEDARERIKAALGWDGDVIFTSGASEAIAIALGRAQGATRLVVARSSMMRCAARAGRRQIAVDARRARSISMRSTRRSATAAGAAGRGPVGQFRDRRDPAARRDRGAMVRAGGRPAARRLRAVAPASCRCPTPT